jgi:tetratricopeptide (TPR) repeat protein
MDACLIAAILSITFLLGVFPLKDADIYWHLRTGDLIRETGQIPKADIFTFTRNGEPWIDLHWVFQVAISWVHEHGGVVGLNLAKCIVTTVAMFLLLTARRREWPVWVMAVAWLPALLLLGGRIYVRPETLTLLYLSIFLAVLFRWDRHPHLAWLLPIVQIAWVNSQGLFVLGPIVLAFALADAAVRFGFFAEERRSWWRTVFIASLLTGAACLVNPYFISGALYPVALAGTMSNPVFSKQVAELMSVPDFLRSRGPWNLSMFLYFSTMALGAISFIVPSAWVIGVKLFGAGARQDLTDDATASRPQKLEAKKKRSRSKGSRAPAKARPISNPPLSPRHAGWRLSLLRLLLFTAFSFLSVQATRNSHQFAAVVGAITAWNFGEWGAALHQRRLARLESAVVTSGSRAPAAALAVVVAVLAWVGSGLFFQMTGEGRVLGLGEEPVFFAHEAAKFAGRDQMPARFVSFHNAHASLFEYYHGPARKVYTDPRLEVAGAELFERYIDLTKRLSEDSPGWEAQLSDMGRPVVMVDHEHNWQIGATLFRSDHWRCVWFDPIVAVFVHDSYRGVVKTDAVDFGSRHFDARAKPDKCSLAELIALAKAARSYAPAVGPPGSDLHQQFTWLGLDDARRALERQPNMLDAWKLLGQIELFRELLPDDFSPRFRYAFDPVLDLSMVRATFALKRAAELGEDDFSTLMSLRMAFDTRLMYEAALSIIDKIAGLTPTNLSQTTEQAKNAVKRKEYQQKLGDSVPTSWRNLSELDEIVTALLGSGRAARALELLERSYPAGKATWPIADRIATLHLHLGEPALARASWEKATSAPQPGRREARIGTTFLVEGDFAAARTFYQSAIKADPKFFEALYCLAVLEADAGDALSARQFALGAVAAAPDPHARTAAQEIAAAVARYANERGHRTTAD